MCYQPSLFASYSSEHGKSISPIVVIGQKSEIAKGKQSLRFMNNNPKIHHCHEAQNRPE